MKVIAIYNNKGGCAKTVTAVNFAYNLSSLGYRVLVIDMDAQGNASSFFRRYDLNKPSVRDFLTGRKQLSRCIKRTIYDKLDILPSNILLREVKAEELIKGVHTLGAIRERTEQKLSGYDYCIIDCPPSADFLIEVVMDAVDNVVIPIKPERFSADGLATVQEVIRDFGHGQVKAGCLFTQFYRNKDILKVVRRVLDTENVMAYENVIRRCSAVDHSVLVRRPLLKCASRSSAALDYIDFTREYLKKEEGEDGIA